MSIQGITADCAFGVQKIADLSSDELASLSALQQAATQEATVRAAATALITQHATALNGLWASMTGNSALVNSDIAALNTIANALQGGTQPTAAQQLIIDRVYLRLLVLLLS